MLIFYFIFSYSSIKCLCTYKYKNDKFADEKNYSTPFQLNTIKGLAKGYEKNSTSHKDNLCRTNKLHECYDTCSMNEYKVFPDRFYKEFSQIFCLNKDGLYNVRFGAEMKCHNSTTYGLAKDHQHSQYNVYSKVDFPCGSYTEKPRSKMETTIEGNYSCNLIVSNVTNLLIILLINFVTW